ncbi:MAG: tRNA (adenosine(37)-N6)-threonylcarbamoyltransferase complex ATPase subunit type 1 TsaE [Bacteroidota bacterium]
MMEEFITHSEQETIHLGKIFSARLMRGSTAALYGDLGAGKTRFIKGVCEGLGILKHVSSPTFTIVHEYPIVNGTVYHFDFYRVRSLQEIIDLGFDDYFRPDNICLIEWAEKAKPLLPPNRFEIYLELESDQNTRKLRIEEIVGQPA